MGDAFESTELAIFTLLGVVLIFTCKCIKSWGWPEERRYRVCTVCVVGERGFILTH